MQQNTQRYIIEALESNTKKINQVIKDAKIILKEQKGRLIEIEETQEEFAQKQKLRIWKESQRQKLISFQKDVRSTSEHMMNNCNKWIQSKTIFMYNKQSLFKKNHSKQLTIKVNKADLHKKPSLKIAPKQAKIINRFKKQKHAIQSQRQQVLYQKDLISRLTQKKRCGRHDMNKTKALKIQIKQFKGYNNLHDQYKDILKENRGRYLRPQSAQKSRKMKFMQKQKAYLKIKHRKTNSMGSSLCFLKNLQPEFINKINGKRYQVKIRKRSRTSTYSALLNKQYVHIRHNSAPNLEIPQYLQKNEKVEHKPLCENYFQKYYSEQMSKQYEKIKSKTTTPLSQNFVSALSSNVKKLFFVVKVNQLKLLNHSICQFCDREVNFYYKGKTPLYHTINNRNIKFTQYLIKRGADIHKICDKETGNYPIHIAFQTGNIEDRFLIKYLIEQGADLNVLNNKLQTPLALASLNVLKCLDLSKGVSLRLFVDKDEYQSEIKQGLIFDNNRLYKMKDQLKVYIAKYRHRLYYKTIKLDHNPQQICEIKKDKDNSKELCKIKNTDLKKYIQIPFGMRKKSIRITSGKLWHKKLMKKIQI